LEQVFSTILLTLEIGKAGTKKRIFLRDVHFVENLSQHKPYFSTSFFVDVSAFFRFSTKNTLLLLDLLRFSIYKTYIEQEKGVNKMKLLVKKAPFIKSWLLAERSTGSRSALTVLTGVKCIADENSVTLQATDLKTSIRCIAEGVEVQAPGEAVFPVKVVGELFKKAPTDTFTIEVDEGKAKINCGEKNHYKFTTYPVSEFPKLPKSEESRPFLCPET